MLVSCLWAFWICTAIQLTLIIAALWTSKSLETCCFKTSRILIFCYKISLSHYNYNVSTLNVSTTMRNMSQKFSNLSTVFYSVLAGNASVCAWNTSAKLNNLSLSWSYWNLSHSNLSTIVWITKHSFITCHKHCIVFSRQCIGVCLEFKCSIKQFISVILKFTF